MMKTTLMILILLAVSSHAQAEDAHDRCARVLESRETKWDLATVERRCEDPETWQLVHGWEHEHQIALPLTTLAPVLLDYYRAEKNYLAQNLDNAFQVRSAGKNAL